MRLREIDVNKFFDKQECLHAGCVRRTEHHSGYCSTHRERKCCNCGKTFTANDSPEKKKPMCAQCLHREKAKKIDKS